MRNSKKGFTLVELLIALAIIGILMVVALAVIPNVMANARDKNRQSTAKTFLTAFGTIKAAEGGSYVPASQAGGSYLKGDINDNTGDMYAKHLQSYLDKALNQQVDKHWNSPFVYGTDYLTDEAGVKIPNNNQGNYYQIAYRSENDKKAHVVGDFKKSSGADATISSVTGNVATVDTVNGWNVGDVAFVTVGGKIKGMSRILDVDSVNKTLTFEQNPATVMSGTYLRDTLVTGNTFAAPSAPANNDVIKPATGLIFGYSSDSASGLDCIVVDNSNACYPYK